MEVVEMDTEPFREQTESVHETYRNLYGDEMLDKILDQLDRE